MQRVSRPLAIELDDDDIVEEQSPPSLSCPPQSGTRRAWETLPYAAELELSRDARSESDPVQADGAVPLVRRRQSTLVDAAPSSARDGVAVGPRRIAEAKTSWEAARTCAGLVCEGLRAKAVLVFVSLESESKLRVIGAAGASASDFLGETIASDDLIASAVLFNERTIVLTFDGHPPTSPSRLRELDARSMFVAVPIMAGGRCVGVIEVVDPDASRGHAVGTTEHLARFVARFLSSPEPRRASGTRAAVRLPPNAAVHGETRRRAIFEAWVEKISDATVEESG
jgi:hypothetical protein